jgi:hypothetical protein
MTAGSWTSVSGWPPIRRESGPSNHSTRARSLTSPLPSSPPPLFPTPPPSERGADPTWTKLLRASLDSAGYLSTRIVAADTGYEVVQQMQADPAFAAAVDVIGVHYPGPTPAAAFTFNKSIFASEM